MIIERPRRTKNTQFQVSPYGDVQNIYRVSRYKWDLFEFIFYPLQNYYRSMKLSIIIAAILAVSVHAVNKKSLKKNEQAMFFDGKQLLALQQFPAKVDR